MKISRIEIKNFHQFQNFELDLTYPKGHEKAGQPLDKVCFIGQSGTGKTTLLKVCKEIIMLLSKKIIGYPGPKVPIHFYKELDFSVKISSFTINNKKELNFFEKRTNAYIYSREESQKIEGIKKFFSELQNRLYSVNFPINVHGGNDSLNRFIEVGEDFIKNQWKALKSNVTEYTNEKSKFRFAISKVAEEGNIELTQKKVAELKKWEEQNPNPLEDLAINFLDPILQQFGLKTKIDLDSLAETEFINFLDKNENLIPQKVWSTGTKQIVFKVLPLYILKPENAIILIDEPENSLYPNIQTKIIDHYLRLAPTCQFFVATHSPIIAASFEPWEIVELKFNEEGNVYREVYFEGENHIDNYFIDPRYYKYGTVLKEIFDLEQEGPDSDFRNKQMMRASRMEATIKRLNKEGKTEEAMKLYEEYKELARKLDWEVNV